MSLVAAEADVRRKLEGEFLVFDLQIESSLKIYSVRAYRGLRFNKEYSEKLAQKRQREKEKEAAKAKEAELEAQAKEKAKINPFAVSLA